MKIYWTKVNQIINESSEVKTFFLDRPEDFTWEEGAYTHLALKGFNAGNKPNRGLVRHMTINTLPHEDSIGITTRIRKRCSEYKERLRTLKVGSEVALFKTRSNIPLKRENKNIYMLSQGVGLATMRPLALSYFESDENISHIYSLNIDSSREFLFTNTFMTMDDKKFISQFVDNRKDYYNQVNEFSSDREGIFYIVGSDEFLLQNIEVLIEQGNKPEQIMLDKNEGELLNFLPLDESV